MGSFFAVNLAEANEVVKMETVVWPPYYSDTLPNNGPMVEITKEAFKRVGITVEVKFVPWARAQENVKAGKTMGLFCPYITEERKKYSVYTTEPVGFVKSGLITLSDNNFTYEKLEDLKKYKFGVLRSTSISKDFDEADYLKKNYTNGEINNLRMLLNGRVDIIAGSYANYSFILKNKLLKDTSLIKLIEPALDLGVLYHSFSKKIPGHKRLRDLFDKGIKMIREDGTYEKILKKHGI